MRVSFPELEEDAELWVDQGDQGRAWPGGKCRGSEEQNVRSQPPTSQPATHRGTETFRPCSGQTWQRACHSWFRAASRGSRSRTRGSWKVLASPRLPSGPSRLRGRPCGTSCTSRGPDGRGRVSWVRPASSGHALCVCGLPLRQPWSRAATPWRRGPLCLGGYR